MVGRPERVEAEGVLEIGQQQFLVLLLVVQPQLDNSGPSAVSGPAEPVQHTVIDGSAIGVDFLDGRP